MTKRVKNRGLSACKSPNGISVRTTEWGAEACVSRNDNTLAITIHHDGNDTPTTVEIPLTDNPYIFDPRAPRAPSTSPRSLDYINIADEWNKNYDADINRAMYRMLCERRCMRRA